jgi:hypothetical protein
LRNGTCKKTKSVTAEEDAEEEEAEERKKR